MNTPIYDQLHAETPDRPLCATCGDYALTEHTRELLLKLAVDMGVAMCTSMVTLDFTEVERIEATLRTIVDNIGGPRQ